MKGARKTTLTFGDDFELVQIPIALAPVVKQKADVKTVFVGPSGEQAETAKYDPATGEKLDAENTKRAIANGDGFVEVDEADWKTITDETKPTEVEVQEFVDPKVGIVADRLATAQDSHFVQAQPGAAGSLGVISAVMEKSGKVAIVRFGTGSRQRVGILRLREDGALVIQTVPFAADIQEADEDVLAASQADVSAKAMKLGETLIRRLAGKGETLATASDEAIERRVALTEELLSGKKPKRSKAKEKKKASSIEDALEKSLA